MKAKDVQVGALYLARVSGRGTVIRITRNNGVEESVRRGYGISPTIRRKHQGYEAINITTGRNIHLRSALRLVRELTKPETTQYLEERRYEREASLLRQTDTFIRATTGEQNAMMDDLSRERWARIERSA